MMFTIATAFLALPFAQGCSILSPNPITGKVMLNEEDDFIMEDGMRQAAVAPTTEHSRLLRETHEQRRLTQWADSTLLPTQSGSYNPDKDVVPWIDSDIYLNYKYDNSAVTEEPNPGPIPDFMEGWLTYADEWPITGFRDDSDANTGFRTQKNPNYVSLADLAPHQIPVNVVALTNRRDLKFGPKMNPYISERRESDYYKLCWDVSAQASRYEGGNIGYSMYDTCHALLYVEDMTIAMNEHLQKRGEMVEFVLMEMSIHQHEECWAPWDASACRSSMANNVDFAKYGMINIFVADAEEPFYMKSKGNPLYEAFSLETGFVRGQTTLGPHTWRDTEFGSHFYVDGGTGRGMQISTHEFQHTLGISHVAGSPGEEYEVTNEKDDSPIQYSALSHPTCEINAIGLWYCSDKYIYASPPQCDESERCCGTRSENDPENHMFVDGECMAPWPLPSAYTPTYAEPFTQIIDNYLYLNNVVPTSVNGPDGTCAGNWDEYSCWDQEGCMWDQDPAVCVDIQGFPDFPAKPHLTVSSNPGEVFPQFGDTTFVTWLDPMQNLHTYVAEAGEEIEVSIDAGICTFDVCARCAGHPPACERPNHGAVDVWIEVLNADMVREGIYSVGNGHHTFSAAGLFYIKIFVKTRRNDKPITHDFDIDAYDDPAMMCDSIEDDDWMNIRNCWTNDFGGPYTVTVFSDDGTEDDGGACEGADSCEVYVDPGTLNGMCVDYSPPSPGCPEQFQKENPGVEQPQKNMDPACWRGKCLTEYSFANDYGYCSDMTTFKWCVHWFCGNGYSEYLEDMPDFKVMEKCLCNPEDTTNSYRSGDCVEFNEFPSTGQFEQIAFGGDEVYRPMGEPVSQGGGGNYFTCSGDSEECAYLGPMLGWFAGSAEPGCGWVDDGDAQCIDWDNSPPDTSCETAADCASLKVAGGCDYVCANPDPLNRGPGQCMWVSDCPDYPDAASVPECDDCVQEEPCQDRECCSDADALASCGTYGDICDGGWCEWSSEDAQKQCQDHGIGCSGSEPFGPGGDSTPSPTPTPYHDGGDTQGGDTQGGNEGGTPLEILHKVTVNVQSEMQISVESVPEEGSQALQILARGIEIAIEKSMADVRPGAKVMVTSVDGRSVVGSTGRRRLKEAGVIFELSLPFLIAEGEEVPTGPTAEASVTEAFEAVTGAINENKFDIQGGMEEYVIRAVSDGEIEGDVASILDDVTESVGEVSGGEGDINVQGIQIGAPEEYVKVLCSFDSDCDGGLKCVFPPMEVKRMRLRRSLFGNFEVLGQCL